LSLAYDVTEGANLKVIHLNPFGKHPIVRQNGPYMA